MRVVTVKAIAKELHERGHYLDELYQITIAYATSLHTRYCVVDARCDAMQQNFDIKQKKSWALMSIPGQRMMSGTGLMMNVLISKMNQKNYLIQ